MKPKLMFVVNTYDYFVSHHLCIAIAALENGYEVHIATSFSKYEEKLSSSGLFLHQLYLNRKSLGFISNTKTLLQLIKIFKSTKPNIVNLISIKPVVLGGLAARLAYVPCVVLSITGLGYIFTSQGLIAKVRRNFIKLLYRIVLAHPNIRAIFENKDDRSTIVNVSGIDFHKTNLINAGVYLNLFTPSPPPDGIPIIMLASRLIVDKGVRVFAEASKIIKANNINARFVLVGEPDPGNPNTITKDELDEWVRDEILEWWGHKNDMQKILPECNIFVLPSFYGEGFPKVLMEAAASSRAIITTDHPGCRDAIEPDKSGILVPVRDANALAEAIQMLISDRKLCEEMGKAGRKLAERKFDVEKVIQQHLQIYNELQENVSK